MYHRDRGLRLDFANAGLYALAERALRGRRRPIEQSLARSRVPRAAMRELLEDGYRRLGPRALLRVGRGIEEVEFHPLIDALLRAASPQELIERWIRLERFGHARNRTRLLRSRPHELALQRCARGAPRPSEAENLVILGLICAVLERAGCRGVRAWVGRRAPELMLLPARGAAPDRAGLRGRTARWWIRWSGEPPMPPPDRTPAARDPSGAPLGRAAALRLAGDPGRRWLLATLARELGVQSRTLQRRLREADLTFSELLRAARIREACRLLVDTDWSLTAIGFSCGFADAAHFSRDFHRAAGLPPSVYRETARGTPRR